MVRIATKEASTTVFQYHRLGQQAADTTGSLAEAAAASDGGTVDVDVVDVAVASGTSGSASGGLS